LKLFSESLKDIDKAIKLNPNNPIFIQYRKMAYAKLGETQKARSLR